MNIKFLHIKHHSGGSINWIVHMQDTKNNNISQKTFNYLFTAQGPYFQGHIPLIKRQKISCNGYASINHYIVWNFLYMLNHLTDYCIMTYFCSRSFVLLLIITMAKITILFMYYQLITKSHW